MIRLLLAALALACLSLPVDARTMLHPACNALMPCQTMSTSDRRDDVQSTSKARREYPFRSKINALESTSSDRHHVDEKRNRRAARGRYLEERLPIGRAIVGPPSESRTQFRRHTWSSNALTWSSDGLVARARAYLGQTAGQLGLRRTLWCSAFLRRITGAQGVDDRAISWLAKPHVGPRVGAIAVVRRKGGAHVGVISGFDRNGNPILISGNHSNRVGEAIYPCGLVVAYVSL